MSKFFIHIGSPKTGSTSIQEFLVNLKDQPNVKGLNFVRAGRVGSSHNALALKIRREEEDAPKLIKRVAQIVMDNPDQNHVLSSEMFFSDQIANAFDQYFPQELKANTRIIAYLRRQDKYVEALYKQKTKTGKFSGPPSTFMTRKVQVINTKGALDAYGNVFGDENMVVTPFEPRNFPNGNVVADFVQRIGLRLEDVNMIDDINANPTFSREVSELLGLVGRMSDGLSVRNMVRDMVAQNVHTAFAKDDCFSVEEKKFILEYFEEENEVIRKRFRPDLETLYDDSDLVDIDKREAISKGERIERLKEAQRLVLVALLRTHKFEPKSKEELQKMRDAKRQARKHAQAN